MSHWLCCVSHNAKWCVWKSSKSILGGRKTTLCCDHTNTSAIVLPPNKELLTMSFCVYLSAIQPILISLEQSSPLPHIYTTSRCLAQYITVCRERQRETEREREREREREIGNALCKIHSFSLAKSIFANQWYFHLTIAYYISSINSNQIHSIPSYHCGIGSSKYTSGLIAFTDCILEMTEILLHVSACILNFPGY